MARNASSEPVALRAQLPDGVELSAHEAAEAIQAGNPNVVRLVKVTSSQQWNRKAQTDPGFMAATVLVDARAVARQDDKVDDTGASQGACVEEWASDAAADARFQTLSLQKRARIFRSHGAIQVLRGNLILRVSEFLDLDEAQQYIDTFLAAGAVMTEDEPEAATVEEPKQISLSQRVLGPRLASEWVASESVELFQNGFVRIASDPPERLVALIFNELRGGVIQRQNQTGWNRSNAKATYLLVIVTERAIRLVTSDSGSEADLLACRRIDIASRMMLNRASGGRGVPAELPRGAGAARTYAVVDERLAQLDEIHGQGLVSDGQYAAIRQRMWGR